MDLVHRFSVPASIDEAWFALNHLDRVAPCFPGARIDSMTGDEFSGRVKIKFGPVLDYHGSGKFLERDETEHRAVIEARGDDLRGAGAVLATVTVQMWENGRLTDVEVKTDLGISGRPAQLGRGVIEDVSNKLMMRFVDCLSPKFAEGIGGPDWQPPAQPVPVSVAGPASPGTEAPGSGATARAETEPAAPAYTPPSDSREPHLNVVSTIAPSLLRRYGGFVALAGLVLFVVLRLVRRVRRKR